MDQTTSYLLEINLVGNPKKARKGVGCFSFEKVVDSELINFKDLVDSIVEQYPPRYMLREVIGSPNGLAICTDAGQPVMTRVEEVFPEAQHRECMFHLVTNFKKRFSGKVFDEHLWAAAYSWNPYIFRKHWQAMENENQQQLHILGIGIKSCGLESNHGFFMHPPLLKAIAGRRKNKSHKGCTEKKRKKGQHKCPICTDYGHHWHNCKRGNPDDIAAMMAERGPPKKKKRSSKKASQSSIVPVQNEAPALSSSMSYPPRCKSRSGSNQPEPLSIDYQGSNEQVHAPPATRTKAKAPLKVKAKRKRKDLVKKSSEQQIVPLDSHAMGTRSKK
ncbi:hypothetical protein C2845_PM09G01870 [Panicum miliaceum]|uniref:MULE transposase domain-containing protein n=1 Tax=Panicum miliaceum TaxID=4540 RepID=A0A3L6S220_PANMI|nr:hypothetical protein C2845_PM09G01870 [Panicum miliaceum]